LVVSGIAGYSKYSNGANAGLMTLDELEGTDLYDILDELRRKVHSLDHG
jgi:hypothetical protein